MILSLFVTSIINAGSGYSVGNMFYYNDYTSGNSYSVQTIGCMDYVSGSNGYRGTSQRIGNMYYYND